MTNIVDYVGWMKSIPFEMVPFGAVDSVVFCQLCYAKLTFLAPSDFPITVRNAYRAYCTHHTSKSPFLKALEAEYIDLFRECAASERFGNVKIIDSLDIYDPENAIQFGATAYEAADFRYIAFRGTDSTIAGWKENFMISFTRIKGQELAADFAEKNLSESMSNYLGGHSKGGHLALYAASELSELKYGNITQVYSLDGPGFCPEVLDLKKQLRVRDKLTRIVPEYSIIGSLFEPEAHETFIVKSSNQGMAQHVTLSWIIDRGELSLAEKPDPSCEWLNDTVNKWIENVAPETRKKVVEELFDSYAKLGIFDFTQMEDLNPFDFEDMIVEFLNTSGSSKRALLHLPLRVLFDDAVLHVMNWGIWRAFFENVLLQSLLKLIIGTLIMFSSQHLLEIVVSAIFIAVTVFEIVTTIRHLIRNGWQFDLESQRIYLCIGLTFVVVWLYIKPEAFYILGSIIVGIIFFDMGYKMALKAMSDNHHTMMRLLHMLEAVLCIIYGGSFFVTSEDTIFAYAISFGLALNIDAFLRIIAWIHDRRKDVS